jgi:eukaryotic-like serine/threonine-protein kinase
VTLSSGARLGPYEIVAPIGAGGMGEVYRALDTRLDREVAVKVLPEELASDAETLARFEREAKAVATLSHPNILAIHDVGSHEGVRYAVTELLEGKTLRGHLEGGPLGPRKAIEYAAQIAAGLAAAHEKGIVHRDLKPENVFVTRDGHVKILDFGLASKRSLDATGREQTAAAQQSMAGIDENFAQTVTEYTGLTEPGTILGTAGYMSPEQVRGRPVDQRSDIFSFGAVLYEMLSGRRAFRADSAVETMNAILTEEPPDFTASQSRQVPPGLERVVRRCLEKDPAHRFQGARDLGFALEAVSGTPATERARSAAPADDALDAAGARPSIAVLVFKDLARNPDNAYLGVGLADATITELATVKSLLVRPTAAILQYQDRMVDPQEAGRQLNVDAVVDASFQRAGSRLRVTVQLVRTSDGRSLWGSKIDTTLDDIFEMQDHVSRKIAEALEVELTPSEERRLARSDRPVVGEAYELYLKGRAHLFHETLSEVNSAIEAFEQARDLDPRFALAWAGLSGAYLLMSSTFEPEGDWHARAEEACAMALSIDPQLPEGRYLRGGLLWSPRGGFDHAGAIRELMAALAGRPGLSEAYDRLAVVLDHVSNLEESLRSSGQALAINPQDGFAPSHLGLASYHLGRYEKALAYSDAAARVSPSAWVYHQTAHCLLRLGRRDEAAAVVERTSRQYPNDVLFFPVRGVIAASLRDEARARQQIHLTIRNKKSFIHYHHAQYDIACIHALLGETEEALDWLTDAAHNGFPCHAFFEIDPFLESIRGEDRFRRLMAELRTECEGYARLYEELRRSPSGSAGASQ